MRTLISGVLLSVSLIALAACSEATDEQPASLEIADRGPAASEAAPRGARAPLADRPDIPVSLPKMAYVFDYGFRLAGEAIAPLQQKHADLCEAQGPYACQIISLSRSGEDEAITGELQLAVVTDRARAFAAQLSDAAETGGAEQFKANISGEDLSKSIVDTEARLRSRIALRDRLLEVLGTRKGTVQELVEAERGVAQVNEEIDRAQSWLQEQKGRVAFSRMTIAYESAAPGGSFLAPIRGALGSLGAILGNLVAVVIVLGAIALPVVAGVLGAKRLRRRLGWVSTAEV